MGFNYGAKIQALLANADDEALSDEARQTYRDKAEQFMRKYRIAEEEALATDPGASVPIWSTVRLARRMTPMDYWYGTVWGLIARHAGVEYVIDYDAEGDFAHVVGYEGDVRYAEYLWTSALLMFVTRIDPTWDSTLPVEENIFRLRNAGIERWVIADKAWGPPSGKSAANRSKVQRIYIKQAAAKGEEAMATGLGHQTDVYRYNYAHGFTMKLSQRLAAARYAVDRTGGAIVMYGRSERVLEALYERYPNRRPNSTPAGPVASEPCPKCTPEKACRLHRWTKADEARYQRYNNSASAKSGRASGRTAADGVEIVRGASGNRPTRLTESNDHVIGS